MTTCASIVAERAAKIEMWGKIKDYLGKYIEMAKDRVNGMQSPIKWMVMSYFGLVVLLVLTYYAAWCYQAWFGKIVMSDLLAVIKEMIGPAMIGFVTFIAGCFIDTNGNGIPDKFEDDDDKGGGEHEHRRN